MAGKWSQLQRCDSLRRAFTHSAKHVLDSSCHDCMDGADCMTKQARGLCLDCCMDGADCRKAPVCPGQHDGAHLASKQATFKHDKKGLTTYQTTYIRRRAEPNCNNKHRKLFACPKSPCDPQRIRPKRQWLHRKLLASPSDGTLLSYLPPPKNKLAQTFPG